MRDVVIFGCGYLGRILARRLLTRGLRVFGTTTNESNLAGLARLGVRGLLVDRDDPRTWAEALRHGSTVVHLAPPDEHTSSREQAAAFASACPGAEVIVYGSSTAAFGPPCAPSDWIDENTIPSEASDRASDRGLRRLHYEQGLRASGLPVRVVRIAAIYGPGRTMRRSIERDALLLFEGAPHTSRIHVEDLARLVEAMLEPGAPSLAIGCDEAPASTLEVAHYTYRLLGRTPPPPIALADAERLLSKTALEMRTQGRRCRSLVREALIGPLSYPTYREGVRASLEAEGVRVAELTIAV